MDIDLLCHGASQDALQTRIDKEDLEEALRLLLMARYNARHQAYQINDQKRFEVWNAKYNRAVLLYERLIGRSPIVD